MYIHVHGRKFKEQYDCDAMYMYMETHSIMLVHVMFSSRSLLHARTLSIMHALNLARS